MIANPALGVTLHAIGGLAAASFYIPYKGVKGWAWEKFWIVGGVFSWLIAPWFFALWLVPGTADILRHSPTPALAWAFVWGIVWGIGGLTFGLTMRYLGIALGYAVALGLCAACGTLIPPLYHGTFGDLLRKPSGHIVLGGVGICLVGIAFSGWAGMSKERELSSEQKKASVKEFRIGLGLVIAVICGVCSAAMAFGIDAGGPISDRAVAGGAGGYFQVLPIFIPVMLGGFLTNFVWCVILMSRNRSFASPPKSGVVRNMILCAVAGIMWYFQFFFYGMGTTLMGKFGFSSWSLHMASIIIFSTLWGIALREWRGTSRRTHALIAIGLLLLIASMTVVGYGNHQATLGG
jgi:L-rhamnose-H+ transport protein